MIKIPKSSQSPSAPHRAERKSPAVPGLKGEKAQNMPGKGAHPELDKPLLLRQSTLDRVMKALASLKLPQAGTPFEKSFEKSLPPLRALLSLLKNTRLPAGSPDLQLAEKFLQGWIDKYEKGLPDRISREIRYLSRLLKSEFQDRRDTSLDGIYLEGEFRPEEQTAVWSLTVNREGKNSSEDEQEFRNCTLDLNLPELGPVKAVLQYGEKESLCGFYSSRRPVRQLIRGGLREFRRHLQHRGFEKLQLRVGRSCDRTVSGSRAARSGVELWG